MNRETIEKIGSRMATMGSIVNSSHRNSPELNKFDHEFNGMVMLLKAVGVRVVINREFYNVNQIESFELDDVRFLCEGF